MVEVGVEVRCVRMVMEVGMEVWYGGVVWRWDEGEASEGEW